MNIAILAGVFAIGGFAFGAMIGYAICFVQVTNKEKITPDMMPKQQHMTPPSKGQKLLDEISSFAPPSTRAIRPVGRPAPPRTTPQPKQTSWPKPEKPKEPKEPKPEEPKPEEPQPMVPKPIRLPPIDWGNNK